MQHIDTLLGEYDVTLADVPGSREVDGEVFEQMARQEALRAHAVVYLCAGDLARTQMEELRWLAEFGKPLLLALNKAGYLGWVYAHLMSLANANELFARHLAGRNGDAAEDGEAKTH